MAWLIKGSICIIAIAEMFLRSLTIVMLHIAHVTFTNVTTTSIQGRDGDRAQRRNEAQMPRFSTAAAALFESLF